MFFRIHIILKDGIHVDFFTANQNKKKHFFLENEKKGKFKNTGNVFDFAINGEGFFTVQGTDNNIYYTRDGSFRVNEAGELVTKEGMPVMGDGGPIVIPEDVSGSASLESAFSVSQDGTVYTFSGKPPIKTTVGRLRIVSFEDTGALERMGAGFYADPEGRAGARPSTAKINQGVLEMANFSLVEEMVGMIKNHRYYETGQVVVKTIDKTFGDLFQIVG